MEKNNRFLAKILERTNCPKHKMPLGLPCWTIRKNVGNGYYGGACGKRIRAAGFVGLIDPKSMNMHRGRTGGRPAKATSSS